MEFQSGGTPPRRNAAFWGGEVPFVTAADLRVLEVDRSCARSFLTEDGWNSGKTAQARPGSILLGTRTRVGRVGVAVEPMAASQDITVLDCVPGVEPRWLARFLLSRASELAAAASGVTIQGITRNFVANFDVPLPPLDEQRRIVDTMSLVERAHFAAVAQLTAIDDLSVALLREIFPRSPTAPLRRGWRWAKLGDECDIVNGSTPRSTVPKYWGGHIRWVTPADLGKLNTPYISGSERSITVAGYESCSTTLVPAGSVVLSTRAPIGHLGIATEALCTNQGCKSLVPQDGLESQFLYYALRHAVDRLRAIGTGATFAEVSKGKLVAFEIPVAPLHEQRRIANTFSTIQRAHAGATAQLAAVNKLTDTLIRQLFSSVAG